MAKNRFSRENRRKFWQKIGSRAKRAKSENEKKIGSQGFFAAPVLKGGGFYFYLPGIWMVPKGSNSKIEVTFFLNNFPEDPVCTYIEIEISPDFRKY